MSLQVGLACCSLSPKPQVQRAVTPTEVRKTRPAKAPDPLRNPSKPLQSPYRK